MLRDALAWIRQHPARCAVYALLAAGAVWAGVTARGILRGQRNDLLTGIARAPLLRGWVQRNFHIRYSIGSVALAPRCGLEIDTRGLNVDLGGAASGALDLASVCASGSGELRGLRIGGGMIALQAARFDWPRSFSATGLSWNDRTGEIASAGAFSVSPGDMSGSLQDLRVLAIANVASASAALAPLALPAVTVKNAGARGIKVDVDPSAVAQAPARLQAAVNTLQSMGTATLPLPAQWSATARKLVTQLLMVAVLLLLVLKALLTRAPASIAWRIAVIVAPFAVFPLLALANSWLVILIAAPVIAIALWAAAYRHAPYWHQRWEPAAVDVLATLLALLLLVLRNWPALSAPPLPAITQVIVAQVDLQDVDATVHQLPCSVSGDVHISISRAGISGLRAGLNGFGLESIDVGRATANGSVQASTLDDQQHIRFLPPGWKKTPPISFCAAVTLRNSGRADVPDAACPAAIHGQTVIARAAVDYAAGQAHFAARWNGTPAPLALAGSASLSGLQVDEMHTVAGSSVRIGGGSAHISWPKSIVADAQLEGIETNGVTVNSLVLSARTPMPCTAGATDIAVSLGKIGYSTGTYNVQVDEAALAFARPDSSNFSATVRTNGLRLNGPVEASVPQSEFRVEGTTSSESIPRTLTAQAAFSTAAVGLSAPIRFTADLWNGDWRLPRQLLTVRQRITSRIPQAVALEFEASGGITSLASPFEANARARLRIPQLIPDAGPATVELNDLRIDDSWDAAAGLSPAAISTGWNVVKFPDLPSGLQLNEVSSLQLSTRGEIIESPEFNVPSISLPSIPQETRFRLQGTPQSIAVFIDGGEQFTLDKLETRSLKASLPGLRLAALDMDTSAVIERAHAGFPVSAHSHLTDESIGTVLTEPLEARVAMTPETVHFALIRPLDTGKLLGEVGLSFDGFAPQATLAEFQADARFAERRLVGFSAAGTLAAGPLVSGSGLEISQLAPTVFSVAAPELPQVTVSASAPGIEINLDDGRLRASAATKVALSLSLNAIPHSPLFTQLSDAAAGLGYHVQKATQVFGAADVSAFPIRWDLDIAGGNPAVSLTNDRIAFDANLRLNRIESGQQLIDGSLGLHARVGLDEGHLLVDLNAPGEIGAFGRRWQFDTPLLLALRRDLLPGSGAELFDSGFYDRIGGKPQIGANPLRLAIGYGEVLQVHTAYQQPFTSGTVGGMAQAAVRWQNDAAGIDSYGTITFRGLEAGAIAFPNAYLEDRLDGDIRFSTRGFVADRLLVPRLLTDASLVHQLDRVDFSAQIRSAADGAHLPGVLQAASGMTLTPANEFVRLLTSGFDLTLPPRALQYKRMALDFQVEQGKVRTEPVLLTLDGVQAVGVAGLDVDSKVRLLWGGRGREPAPLLRDLIYTAEKVMEP